jgi:hypothetical protein
MDGIGEHLDDLEERAGIIMQERRAIEGGDLKQITEHFYGDFDNDEWLKAELEGMGERFDNVESSRRVGQE